ncbi:Malate dehydrogenase, cytoplasmic [Coemansia sp. RSA 1813]|nr:Malate dehydrogenase, cytoplasmic [Coemansia sp. RSA 1646]KAJ1773720.1 Malate dehydrogenase, cytoplasmic [Coemansia sp. RSA 1843]KAJ2093681.1 Malate dehydrogenase, cytoplasmic [Coemansia sp. RSA 986]KAJ2217894.1 Malate dehydrogenase, cytoplasmic [Coemansia sp. RSA 487]KAJ2573268.1 Malate dehydrogenase, cytoplasmic [Coemansia sp. RSA 1813]
MFATRNAIKLAARSFSTAIPLQTKVTVLGAAGGIGQPLSLLLKANPRITELGLYDIHNTPGVAADVGHINTLSNVTGYTAKDKDGLKEALKGAELVVIPAGVPRKPGMTRDDLFNTNASIVRDLAQACAEVCPKAKLLIISNPVNSTVPIATEVFKKAGVYDPKRIFGVTSLDLVRASRFIGDKLGKIVDVPVVGGHAGVTIIPLFSQVKGLELGKEELDALTYRVQFGGDEVVKAKDGLGSATLSMAFAGARFADSLLRAKDGESVLEWAFIRTDLFKEEGLDFFSTYVKLDKDGVKEIMPLPESISEYEKDLVKKAIPELKKSETKGTSFVGSN